MLAWLRLVLMVPVQSEKLDSLVQLADNPIGETLETDISP